MDAWRATGEGWDVHAHPTLAGESLRSSSPLREGQPCRDEDVPDMRGGPGRSRPRPPWPFRSPGGVPRGRDGRSDHGGTGRNTDRVRGAVSRACSPVWERGSKLGVGGGRSIPLTSRSVQHCVGWLTDRKAVSQPRGTPAKTSHRASPGTASTGPSRPNLRGPSACPYRSAWT